jgi:hypothetical protein
MMGEISRRKNTEMPVIASFYNYFLLLLKRWMPTILTDVSMGVKRGPLRWERNIN